MRFKLDKEKIASCFRRAKSSYDYHGVVQKKVGDELVDTLSSYADISYDRVLEIGCCTGIMTETLCQRFHIGTLFVNDLVSEFQQVVFNRIPRGIRPRLEWISGDIESCPIPNNLDLVVSSATVQWLEDLTCFFKKVAESLNDNGYFVFSLFGPGTLEEFRKLTGVGLLYYELEDIIEKLEQSFVLEFVNSRQETLFFSTPHLVLKHFQATGVGGVSEYQWTTRTLREFEKEYRKRFETSDGVPVTYVSSLVVAIKR